MIDRRLFLKLTGVAAAAAAGVLHTLPAVAQVETVGPAPMPPVPELTPTFQAPGLYQISGRVQLQDPLVEISGISNAQQISWAGATGTARPVTGFTTFEYFDRPWSTADVQVRGGQLMTLAAVPLDIA